MTPAQFLQQPFTQIALPIMATMIGINNRRLDVIVGHLDSIGSGLLRIEERLAGVERKVDALELKAWR